MKFTINSKPFKEIIDRAAACADKKSKLPICGCVEIFADKGDQTVQARCITSDLKEFVHSIVWTKADVMQSGSAVVGLDDIANVFGMKDDITVESDGLEKLAVSSRKKRSELAIASPEFPETVYVNEELVFEADKEDFIDTLKRLSPFCADTDVKAVHRGYNINYGKICAIDSHKMAYREYPWSGGKMPFSGEITIPGRVFADMKKISKNKLTEDIALYTDRKNATIQGSDFIYSFSLLAGEFMKYERVIPANLDHSFRVNTENLEEITKQYSKFLNPATKTRSPMYFAYSDGKVYTVGISPTYRTFDILETSDENIAEDYIQAFQAIYLTPVMDLFGKSEIALEFTGRTIDPMCFSGDDGYFALVLPVRPGDGEVEKVREFISADKAA